MNLLSDDIFLPSSAIGLTGCTLRKRSFENVRDVLLLVLKVFVLSNGTEYGFFSGFYGIPKTDHVFKTVSVDCNIFFLFIFGLLSCRFGFLKTGRMQAYQKSFTYRRPTFHPCLSHGLVTFTA